MAIVRYEDRSSPMRTTTTRREQSRAALFRLHFPRMPPDEYESASGPSSPHTTRKEEEERVPSSDEQRLQALGLCG